MPIDKTPNIQLPYIYTNQAQKEVSINEAFTILDAIWNNGVVTQGLATPPGSPTENDAYIIAAAATGAWSGKEQYIAYYNNGWRFIEPREGITIWVNDEDLLYTYDGTDWAQSSGSFDELPILGINTTADTTNKFAVASEAVLITHDGDDIRVKVNKAASGDTASYLFQDNFSGRAEVGLCGDDNFHFKVSPDGSTWSDSIIIDRTSGNTSFNSHKITNVTDPTSAQDAATKAYVDANAGGLTDGDKGDVTVSSSGATWTIDNDADSRWEFVEGSRHGGPNQYFDTFSECHSSAPFSAYTSGTGAGTILSAFLANNATQKTIGVIDCSCGTTSTGRGYMGTSALGLQGGLGCALFMARVAPQNLSDGTESYRANVGFNDASAATAVVDGCFWEYDHATSTDWRTVTISNSTSTKNTITGLTVSTTVMPYLGVFCNGNWSNIDYFYSTDGETWAYTSSAHTANIPTGTSRVFGAAVGLTKYNGSTARSLSVDYMGYRYMAKRGA